MMISFTLTWKRRCSVVLLLVNSFYKGGGRTLVCIVVFGPAGFVVSMRAFCAKRVYCPFRCVLFRMVREVSVVPIQESLSLSETSLLILLFSLGMGSYWGRDEGVFFFCTTRWDALWFGETECTCTTEIN
jgi:hypothetical protein